MEREVQRRQESVEKQQEELGFLRQRNEQLELELQEAARKSSESQARDREDEAEEKKQLNRQIIELSDIAMRLQRENMEKAKQAEAAQNDLRDYVNENKLLLEENQQQKLLLERLKTETDELNQRLFTESKKNKSF